jgi:hypothetical protein
MPQESSPTLHEVQRSFARALLGGDEAVLLNWIGSDGIAPALRLGVYRNNVHASLSQALGEMFPVVRRLVGEGFFSFAASEFISAMPPTSPCVADFGDMFADFLAGFEPCRDHAYLPDVARFERFLHDAARLGDLPFVAADGLDDLTAEDAARLVFQFQPTLRWIKSDWPLAAIWQANQEDGDGTVEPGAGGSNLEIRRRDGVVEFRQLPPSKFIFRTALSQGATLASAIDQAMNLDPAFDAVGAFVDLFADRMVTAFNLE